MKIFLIAVICFSLGVIFGVFIMCLMQIKKGSDYDASIIIRERETNEQNE